MPSVPTPPTLAAAVLALALALTGCDQATPPSAVDTPILNAAAAKAVRTSGAFVFHGDVPGGLLMVDFDRERTLLVGNTAAQLAGICATGIFPEEITEHDVLGPNGTLHVLLKAKSLPAVVWPVLSVDPCADLQGVAPEAEGIANGIYTDNNLFGNGTGASSFGVTAQGRMTETATGRPVQLHAKFRNVFLPDGTIKLPVIHIILR